jgi:hypothetical protein
MRKEAWFGLSMMALVVGLVFFLMPPPSQMTNGHLGLLMLAMIVVAIMLGFPTAFTLMGLGTMFAWFAYRSQNPETAVAQTLDLMALRAYAVMCNDVLISVPLFVFMGYLVERANLIQRLFKGLHLATASIPGSLAVATIVTCAIFSTASGIIGAVVTVMGLLAFPAMLKAGYGVRLAAGAVTAGGTLGILIPPSVLLILYGATAGVSVVQLYAGAFFPGIMLAALYVIYVIVCAKLWPSAAPQLSEEERRVDLPKFAEFISRTMSRNALAGMALAIKGKRNARSVPWPPFSSQPLHCTSAGDGCLHCSWGRSTSLATDGRRSDARGRPGDGLRGDAAGNRTGGRGRAFRTRRAEAHPRVVVDHPEHFCRPAGNCLCGSHLCPARDLQDAADFLLSPCAHHPRGARHHHRRARDAGRSSGHGRLRRVSSWQLAYRALNWRSAQGSGVSLCENQRHGVLALRGLQHFRGSLSRCSAARKSWTPG